MITLDTPFDKKTPPLKIIHIAPQNISDVPMTFVRAERALGHYSRLITFFRDPREYPEDVCLELPLVKGTSVRMIKSLFSDPARSIIQNKVANVRKEKPVWRPAGPFERAAIRFREWLWEPELSAAQKLLDFWNFDVYQFDAGLDFFRDARTIVRLKRLHKKIIVCYTGSDFRTRGVIPTLDENADVRITLEWDHLAIDPGLEHLLFPFETDRYQPAKSLLQDKVRIGHAPTNRDAKGSMQIIDMLNELTLTHEVEMVLIENMPHAEAMKLKSTCDIFIDQIGDLGYGINALEALAMGIPACTCLTPAFKQNYPDHPFCELTEYNMLEVVRDLIENEQVRKQTAAAGIAWLKSHHDSRHIVNQIHRKLKDKCT